MKIFVKNLNGSRFEIEVKPEDTVADVKKNIEAVQGSEVYPAGQQMLIHQGKVLKDETTLEENRVAEKGFMVVMVNKSKASSGGAATTSSVPSSTTGPASDTSMPMQPLTAAPTHASTTALLQTTPESAPIAASTHALSAEMYDQAASNLVAGSNLQSTIQQILDMGGGSWDRDMVVRALKAAYNNPERAVEYLYSGIPGQAVPPVAQQPAAVQPVNPSTQTTQPAVPSSGPNANPLDLFPQGLPNMGSDASASSLDFLRNSQQFQLLRAMVQANPQMLQPILQELGKQNPELVRAIQENQADFLRLVNEPVEGEGDILGPLGEAIQEETVAITPEEHEAVQRLEAMGFERALVLQVYFACNKNEELAANYLLDHMHEDE